MSLRAAVDTAVAGRPVPPATLEAAFDEIMSGDAPEALVAALLVALHIKGETVSEIVAAARALRARAVRIPGVDPRTLDTCGTGGDGADTFNISTAASFVVAGAGVPVAKHGNRAASGRTGSIDVFEALGVQVDLPVAASAEVLREVGIAPFFARVAHPAMAKVAPVRATLGFRTLMNCLGPLLNPMGVKFQLVGVYSSALVEPLAQALGELGAIRALVVHGCDGLDEVTTTGRTEAALFCAGSVTPIKIESGEFGFPAPVAGALRGGDAKRCAAIIRSVLAGEKGAQRDVTLINAGAALWVAGAAENLHAGCALARESVDSGAARERLERLIEVTSRAAASG